MALDRRRAAARSKRREKRPPRKLPLPQLPGERWLPYADLPEYQVSNLGRVRSIKRHGKTRGRVLSLTANSDGYLQASMRVGETRLTRSVHVMVLETFDVARPFDERGNPMEGSHINGDQTNNTLENLEWESTIDNRARKSDHGTAATALSAIDARIIYRMKSTSASQRQIAKAWGVSQVTVHHIQSGQTWAVRIRNSRHMVPDFTMD